MNVKPHVMWRDVIACIYYFMVACFASHFHIITNIKIFAQNCHYYHRIWFEHRSPTWAIFPSQVPRRLLNWIWVSILLHYIVLFDSQWGYYNSLILQALELIPGRTVMIDQVASNFSFWVDGIQVIGGTRRVEKDCITIIPGTSKLNMSIGSLLLGKTACRVVSN